MATYTQQYRYSPSDEVMQIDPITGLPINPYTAYAPPPVSTAAPRITNESDPIKAAQQDRLWSYGRGEDLDRDLRSGSEETDTLLRGYRQTGNDLYDPLLFGNAGIPQSELDNILRQGELAGLNLTDEEIADAYLNNDERAAMLGNASTRGKYFNPNFEADLFGEGAGRRRGAVDEYGTSLEKSFDPSALRPGEGFARGLQAGADTYGRNVRETLDPSGLTVSDDFLSDYRMTPEEEQAIRTGAALTVGTRDKAAIAEMERRARAAGTNPLGVAALRNRFERQSKGDAADAATQAAIGASEAAANRLKTGENMRLQYGQNLAGMRTAAEQEIADAAYRAAVTGENARSGAERDIADRRFAAADRSGQARIGNETDLARERLALQQNTTQVGNQIERDIDDTMTNRFRDVSLNRQATAQGIQGQKYGRGLAASDRLSDRYRYGTDARRADQQEGRGYVREQIGLNNANAVNNANRRLQLYGTQAGLGQEATRTAAQIKAQKDAQPKLWEKLLGTGLGVASSFFGGGATGGVITEPTYAMLGEDGPEMVIPLNGRTDALVPPSMALQPGQPVPFATQPPPNRLKAAYSQQYRYAV